MKHLTRITALSVPFCLFILQGCSQKSTTESSKSSNESSTANTRNSAPQKAKAKRPAPDFTVTAKDLAKEFRLDREMRVLEDLEDYEKAAKESKKIADKYADKEVAVSGRISDVNTARTPMRVSLKAGDEGRGSVSGDFDEEERASLCPLKEDQKVTIQCLGGSDRAIGQPDLKRCTIVNVE